MAWVDWLAISALATRAGRGRHRERLLRFYRQLKVPGEVLSKHYVSDPGRTSFGPGSRWNA